MRRAIRQRRGKSGLLACRVAASEGASLRHAAAAAPAAASAAPAAAAREVWLRREHRQAQAGRSWGKVASSVLSSKTA